MRLIIKETLNLELLKNFYKNVFLHTKYAKNDILLYEIFNENLDDKEKHITLTRISALSNLYSAKVDNIHDIIDVINECMINLNCYDNPSTNKLDYNCIIQKYHKDKKNHNLQSFVSKYCHWYNEVNGRNSTPIYDGNVKESLNLSKNCTYENVNSKINTIIKIIYKNKNDRIKIELNENKIKNLIANVSIHRLIDKCLWLLPKINSQDEEMKEILKNKNVTDFFDLAG